MSDFCHGVVTLKHEAFNKEASKELMQIKK